MPANFCLTVRFLDPVPSFHGRCDGGEPEWPPSPLRIFQALVAAAAARWREGAFADYAAPALAWLQTRTPVIVAPSIRAERTLYRLYVPNNAADLVTAAWARGNPQASIAEHRVEKDVRPTRLAGSDCLYYHWNLPDAMPPEVVGFLETLAAAARSITHLGWGIDMVAVNATTISEADAAELPGEVWRPAADSSGTGLRVPIPGTLDDLIQKHQAFLNRIERDAKGNESFMPVPPLSAFRVVAYRRATDYASRPIAAFSILRLDASGFRPFDAGRKGLTVAGMMRHATDDAARAAGWKADDIKTFILGHGEPQTGDRHVPVGLQRFVYMPLPSIEFRGRGKARVVGSIRRILITTFAQGWEDKIAWSRRVLSGRVLIDKDTQQPQALLSLLPTSDKALRPYLPRGGAATWATVTPVILPGYDGGDASKAESLLRKTIVHAGLSQTLANHAELDWRKVGFWPGVDLPSRYGVPNHLRHYPRFHVRITWRDSCGRPVQVPGPLCIGGGRFYGLGLFAAEP